MRIPKLRRVYGHRGPRVFQTPGGARSPEFFERFRRGDRDVIEQLYWAHVDVVEHVLKTGFWIKSCQITVPGVADSDQRADLLQEVFIRAFSPAARRSFDPALDYRSYVLSISRHLLVDHYRKVRRRPIAYDPDLDQTPADPLTPDEQSWRSSALIQVAERYVAGLETPLRELHHARYALSRSQQEVANDLGLSRQNVRTLEERLKAGLRSALHEAWRAERSVRNALEGTRVEPKLARF